MKPNDKHPTGAPGNHPPNEGQNFSITEETLLRASRFRVDRVRQTFADGRIVEREVIRHPGAVVIVPVLDDGRICLIRNYRVAVGSWLFELPAGTLEPHEPPSQTAERELIEETGYRASRIEPLCQLLMSPGILHERMHAFVATGLSDGDAAREEGELIVNHLMSLDEVDVALRTQQIEDAKTIAALLYYLRYYSR